MFGTMTKSRARAVEAQLNEPEAVLWCRLLEFAVTPPGKRRLWPGLWPGLAQSLGISPERESELVQAVFLTVEP